MTYSHRFTTKQFWFMLLALFVALPLILSPDKSLAQEPLTLAPYLVTLPPGATVEVVVNGFCLNRGLPFPGEEMTPGGLSPETVRVAIAHIVEQNYIEEDLYQTQLAIWNLTDGLHPEDEDHYLADDIIAYANDDITPADADVGVPSLPEAIKDGTVSAIIQDYVNIAPPPFFYFGEGTLEITNLTDQEQTIHIPYGTTFKDPNQSGVQDMGIFPSHTDDTACDPVKVTVPENGTTDINVYGYCMDREADFPESALTAVSLAPDKVRKGICHNVQQGYLADNLYESQLGIWDLIDSEKTDEDLAEEIVAYGENDLTAIDTGSNGKDLPQAIDDGLITASVTGFEDIAPSPYDCFGQGTLSIANETDTPQEIYIPYGTIFEDATQSDVQNMAIFISDGSAPVVEPEPELLPTSGGPGDLMVRNIALILMTLGLFLLSLGYTLQHRFTL